MLKSLRIALLVAGSVLYITFVAPLRLLAGFLKHGPDAVFLLKPSTQGIAVELKARGELLKLVYTWATGMGFALTPQGYLVRRSRLGELRGQLLSIAASMKTYMESRGYAVRVVLKEVFGGELFAVIEVKRKNLLLRILEAIGKTLNALA